MATSVIIKVATWNMQKGPALASTQAQSFLNAGALSARHQVLGFLISDTDITFIQESPADIREETQRPDFSAFRAHEKEWVSYDRTHDNQSHRSANRPAFYSNHTIQALDSPSDCPANGHEDAFRLSAIGRRSTSVGYGVFISLHATSGWNAKSNTTDYLSWLCKWLKEDKSCRFAIVGGDFNHRPPHDVATIEGCAVTFCFPGGMTQQSGSTIDGFCSICVDPTVTAKWSAAQRVVTGEKDGPIETQMARADPNIGQMHNQRGYLGKVKLGDLPGTVQSLSGSSDMWVRMSDHCAVVGSVTFTCPDDSVGH